IANDEHQRAIALAIRLDVATAESLSHQFEHLSPVAVLADVKLGHKLESDAARWVALDGDGERTLAVDVAGDVAIERFCAHVAIMVNGAPDDPKERPPRGGPEREIGGYLLSREVALRVPSAQAGLTSLFGMGRGVSPPL